MQILYILQLLWNTTLPAIKVSILLFYRHLFSVRRLLVASSIIGATVLLVHCDIIHHRLSIIANPLLLAASGEWSLQSND